MPDSPIHSDALLQALCDAGIKDADSVVITGTASSDLPLAEADHCTMAVMLQVQEAVRASGRTKPPHVVARVRATATATAISDFLTSVRSVSLLVFGLLRGQGYLLVQSTCMALLRSCLSTGS